MHLSTDSSSTTTSSSATPETISPTTSSNLVPILTVIFVFAPLIIFLVLVLFWNICELDSESFNGQRLSSKRSEYRRVAAMECPKSILRWRREGCVMGRRGVKGSEPAGFRDGEGGGTLVKRVSWPDGGEEGKRLEERFVSVYLLERGEMDGEVVEGSANGSAGEELLDLDGELI